MRDPATAAWGVHHAVRRSQHPPDNAAPTRREPSSFREWSRSYRDSPTLPAKIVDRILKLGNGEADVFKAAERERLTIGESALREHATPPNGQLHDTAAPLRIRIGELATPEVLWTSKNWRSEPTLWTQLAALPAPQRDVYVGAAVARPDDSCARWIEALRQGPMAMLEAVAADTTDSQTACRVLLGHVLGTPRSPPFWARLRALAAAPETRWSTRQWRAGCAMATWYGAPSDGRPDPTGPGHEEILSWARDETLRRVGSRAGAARG